jgi:hypothetical protein
MSTESKRRGMTLNRALSLIYMRSESKRRGMTLNRALSLIYMSTESKRRGMTARTWAAAHTTASRWLQLSD